MIFNNLTSNSDNEWLMIDSSILRAHQHSVGLKKSEDRQECRQKFD